MVMSRLQRSTILITPNPRPLAWAVTFRAFGASRADFCVYGHEALLLLEKLSVLTRRGRAIHSSGFGFWHLFQHRFGLQAILKCRAHERSEQRMRRQGF